MKEAICRMSHYIITTAQVQGSLLSNACERCDVWERSMSGCVSVSRKLSMLCGDVLRNVMQAGSLSFNGNLYIDRR